MTLLQTAYCLDANYGKGTNNLLKHNRTVVLQQMNGPQKHSTNRLYSPEGVARRLRANAGGKGAKTGLYVVPVLTPDRETKRQNGRRFKENGEPSFTLTSQDKHRVYLGNNRIRRLTPLECERLQGFPDKWTEGVSDSQRYKQLGNAVTVNVVETIIKQMEEQNAKIKNV